jgi:hypothetical protein
MQNLVLEVGVEQESTSDNTEVIDSNEGEKRQ